MVLKKHSKKKLKLMAQEYRCRCPDEKVRNDQLYEILSHCDEVTFDAITSKLISFDGCLIPQLDWFMLYAKGKFARKHFPVRTLTKAFFVYGLLDGKICFKRTRGGGIHWTRSDPSPTRAPHSAKGKPVKANRTLH